MKFQQAPTATRLRYATLPNGEAIALVFAYNLYPSTFNLPPHPLPLAPVLSAELFNVIFLLFLRYYPDYQSNFKIMFTYQATRLLFLFSLIINCLSFNAFVLAQPSNDSDQPPDSSRPSRRSTPIYRRSTPPEEDKQVKDIKSQITQNKEVKTMCSNYFNNITFESTTKNQLRIDTGNNFCSYTIVKEILEPQLNTGKIRTYQFTGDREGVIVYFN